MKRIISVLLSLIIVLLMLTVGIVSTTAAGTASITVNGKTTKAAVGSTVTYKVDLYASELFENIQAIITYNSRVLKIDRYSNSETCMPNITGAILNSLEAGYVYFNASKVAGYNFKSTKNLVTLEFEVLTAGSATIDLEIEEMAINGGDEYYFTDSHPEVTNGITVSEYVIAEPIATTPPATTPSDKKPSGGSSNNSSANNGSTNNGSSGSGSSNNGSSSDRTSSVTVPADAEDVTSATEKTATINNIEVEVGDTVSYTFCVEKMTDLDVRKITGVTICTFFDQKALELVSVSADNLKGATVINDNQNKDGQIVVTNSMINGLEGLDIDSRVSFFTATFKVKEAVKSEIAYYIPYMYDINLNNISNYKLTYDLKAKDTGSSVTEEVPILAAYSDLSKIADIGDFVNTVTGYSYPTPTEPTETEVVEESEFYEISPVVPEKAETDKGRVGVSGILGILLIIGVVLLVILGGVIVIAVPAIIIIIIVVCVKKKKKKALAANPDTNIVNNDNING